MVANDQAGRDAGLWLSPHELEKEFNAAKRANPSLTFVDRRQQIRRPGRMPQLPERPLKVAEQTAQIPQTHLSTRRDSPAPGSFLAASGMDKIQYDGHRRIRLPYLGSVRMTRPLPDGIPYEVSVRKHNGRWYASVAYWKPPTDEPHRETQSAGGVDVGINPLAMDSDGVTYDNPRGYYQAQRRLKRWQRSQARRTKDSQGWWEDATPYRQRSPPGHGTAQQRAPSGQPGPGRQVPHPGYRNPERRGHDQGRTPTKGPGRRRHVQTA